MPPVSILEIPPAEKKTFQRRLLSWFARRKRDLPWRRTRDPYRIWLSEIMLQQTRVAAVIPYYERFLAKFPTVQALARAKTETVLGHWAGLGYYSRASNLQRAAKEMVSRHAVSFLANTSKRWRCRASGVIRLRPCEHRVPGAAGRPGRKCGARAGADRRGARRSSRSRCLAEPGGRGAGFACPEIPATGIRP